AGRDVRCTPAGRWAAGSSSKPRPHFRLVSNSCTPISAEPTTSTGRRSSRVRRRAMALDCEATASWLGSTICSAADAAAPNLNCLESGERRQAPADRLAPFSRLARSFSLAYIAGIASAQKTFGLLGRKCKSLKLLAGGVSLSERRDYNP